MLMFNATVPVECFQPNECEISAYPFCIRGARLDYRVCCSILADDNRLDI
jgi:hypothetical protein